MWGDICKGIAIVGIAVAIVAGLALLGITACLAFAASKAVMGIAGAIGCLSGLYAKHRYS